MNPDKSPQNLFNEALERADPIERARFLDEACGADAALRERVEKLLRSHDEAGGFFSQPSKAPSSAPSPGTIAPPVTEKPGDRIGRYKLLQQIGEGGCGVVYMAEQEEPVRRRVALKVIKLGMDTKQVIARFDAERQALALMDHPNIAKVLDAGATETGRPYFVMELVRGVKITEFCDENKLPTEDRLKLFIQVCQAIQHAHQKGIIHRDIKPSNILVTISDGVPVPKVIDFGIAKATAGRLTNQTLFTAFEQFIGTPAYMSPEQALLSSVEVDTRSDIYSLGVLLYELLTGLTPFDQKELLAAGLDEMRRTLREREPALPSTRLTAMASGDLTTVATRRHSQPAQLIQLVRGDLDWIVMKCLQKDRARRYETVNGLAMDLTRHLNLETVLARPDTQVYRITKFVSRNRASVTFATVVLVALTGGLAGTITQARRATRHAVEANAQREFALRQLARTEVINGLNSFLLSDAAPVGKPFTVGELLARAERVLERQTGDTDANRVQVLIAIGHQYENQDQHGKARELLTKAYYISRQLPEPSVRAEAAATLSVSVALAGDTERGEALIQEALRDLGDAPEHVMHRVFCYLRGSRVAREAGREELGVERVLTAQRLVHDSGRGTPLLQLTMAMELAESYRMAGKNREAAAAFAIAYPQLVALGRDQTEKAGTLLNNWGLAVDGMGLPLEAEQHFRRAMEISRADETNYMTVSPMLLNNFARTLFELQRYAEAAQFAELAYEKALGAGDEHVVNMSLNVRTGIYREQGDLERAGRMLDAFEGKTKQLLPEGHIAFAVVAVQKAMHDLASGEAEAALVEMGKAISLVETKPELRDRLSNFLWRRAKVLIVLKRFEEARADAARALSLNRAILGAEANSSWSGRAFLEMGRALQAQDNRVEAGVAYASALKHLRPTLGEDHPETHAAARGLEDNR